MKKSKKFLLRLCSPGVVQTILLAVCSIAGLILVFTAGWNTTPLAYLVYVVSFYTLVVLAFAVFKGNLIKKSKAIMYNTRYGKEWMTDILFRTRLSLFLSLLINVTYAVLQLLAGLYYTSFWSGAVGIYYFIVCSARFTILRNFQKRGYHPKKDLRVYRFSGCLLFALNIAAAGMVIQIVSDGKGARYPGLMIYAMAAYAFYRITVSIIHVVKYRKLDNPVLSASKNLGLATALMAIFSLQTAMLAEFGGESALGQIITPATGTSVCVIILFMATFMIVQANRKIKQLNFEVNTPQT